jgi:UDP-N-acetylmuramoylalanine--D-glutamate ligase
MKLSGSKILVVGMARSGLAAVTLLREHGATPIACDTRPLAELPEVEALGVEFRQQSDAAFENVDAVVIAPGVPADIPPLVALRSRGIPVLGELELAGYFLKGPSVGITGANGKTTTTALTGHVLNACGIPCQVGGNIGTPPAAMVAPSRYGQWNVLELSSFQLETTARFRAEIGAVINITPDHLDRHHTFENYAAAKRRLFETQTPGDFAILNADNPPSVAFAAHTDAEIFWFSQERPQERGIWVEQGEIRLLGQRLMSVADVPLRGRHNLENVMAAAAAAWRAGAAPAHIAAAVASFPGVEHRIEFVRTVSGVSFFNDSKATNVDATLKAIDAFSQPLWIILGGKDKGSDYTVLIDPLKQRARAALLIGKAADKIASHLGGAIELVRSETIDRAVETAYRRAAPGDIVLLAPACASFDQFTGYEQRGRIFKDLVHALQEKS